MVLKKQTYDILKWVGLVLLDAVGACYKGIAAIWGLPYGLPPVRSSVPLSVRLLVSAQLNSERLRRPKHTKKLTIFPRFDTIFYH